MQRRNKQGSGKGEERWSGVGNGGEARGKRIREKRNRFPLRLISVLKFLISEFWNSRVMVVGVN
jgi:hypothetical protein